MGEKQRSERKRVCSSEPNAVVYASFLYRYIGYLLPALAKATANASSCCQIKDQKLKSMVRFEVDMALALSANGFKWSRALRHKLEHRRAETPLITSESQQLPMFLATTMIPRSLAFVYPTRPKGSSRRSYMSLIRVEDEYSRRVRALRKILPGGNEMCLSELLYEVKSYMVYLQLQVNILKSLVEAH
ncbi:transcription factor bHLH146-like [Curcuma longa]|uniref:transcription factor bHLH146-like n=1 Tax=Curcuma longa TaxID=136217 RepID=UPI003D9F07E1